MAQPELIAGALWQQAQIAYQRGDLARCELEGRSAIEVGGDFAGRLATPWLVMALAEQGRLDEAEQLLESAGMLGPIPPNILLTAIARQPRAPAARPGRRRRARSRISLPHAIATRPGRAQRVEPPWRPLLAEALVLADRVDEAAEEADVLRAARRPDGAPAGRWGTPPGCARSSRRASRRSRCSKRPERISRPATLGSSSRAA